MLHDVLFKKKEETKLIHLETIDTKITFWTEKNKTEKKMDASGDDEDEKYIRTKKSLNWRVNQIHDIA